MKNLLFSVVLITAFTFTSAQEELLTTVTPEQEKAAEELAMKFDDELSLTEMQLIKFQDKIETYTAYRDRILNAEYSLEKKNRLLRAYYVEESREMGDILTRPQLFKYRKVRSELQPLYILSE